jgi:hypothetical protein
VKKAIYFIQLPNFLVLIPVLLSIVSCQGYSITGGPGKTVQPSLISKTERSSDLLNVNSILVQAVEVHNDVKHKTSQEVNFDQLLKTQLESSLNIKLVFAKDIKDSNQKVDAKLITKIIRYINRQGSALGSERPAEIDLVMMLVRISDGKTIWSSSYYYKDKALSENLFRIGDKLTDRNGPQFKNAKELLIAAYHSAIEDLSSRRLQEFSAN